jgi:hypothetical protein
MRRAIALLLVLIPSSLAIGAPTPPARPHPTPIMNAIGLIDYTKKPTFKVGDWVRYHVTGANDKGDDADYTVTILIAGEERFWGEEGFWVETRTQSKGADAPLAIATLMSYAVFQDTLALPRMKLFMRKTITDVAEDGTPQEDVTRRPPLTLKNRKPPSEHTAWSVDTLDADTVRTPSGEYACRKIRMEEGVAATADYGDSSSRTEVRDTRTEYYTLKVPITHLAREHIENSVRRKSWLIGHSKDAEELRLVGLSAGDARLVDFGTGLVSGIIPERFRRSLREQDAAANRAPAAARAKRARG